MRKLDRHTLLSALWLFILLNILFRDIHQMMLKSHLEMLLTGSYNGTRITDELMLLGGFLALVPISMVLLSLVLERRWLRPASAVGVVFTAAPAMMAPPTDMDDVLHVSVALLALVAFPGSRHTGPRTRGGLGGVPDAGGHGAVSRPATFPPDARRATTLGPGTHRSPHMTQSKRGAASLHGSSTRTPTTLGPISP
jgi:hypothetical protein